jgi:hypothetical protein
VKVRQEDKEAVFEGGPDIAQRWNGEQSWNNLSLFIHESLIISLAASIEAKEDARSNRQSRSLLPLVRF